MPADRRRFARPYLVRRVRAAAVAVTASVTALTVFMACGGTDDQGSRGERPAAAPGPPAPSGSAPADSSAAPAAVGWNRSPASIAAVGDSITRGFDACSVLSDCPAVSWATGTNPSVTSLAQRLLTNPAGRSWNLARSGALMAELPEQMKEAALKEPALVTVLIGANDACRDSTEEMTSVAGFRADFTEALRILRAELPEAQVFVASVPDLKRLWSEGRRHPMAPRVWQLGICRSMLGDPHSVAPAAVKRRQQVQDRVVAYNTVLREVCSRDARCRHDGGAVFDYRFTTEELSPWDWFHPSKQGQQRLADIAYRTVTAAQAPE